MGTPMDKEGIVAGRNRPHPQGDFQVKPGC